MHPNTIDCPSPRARENANWPNSWNVLFCFCLKSGISVAWNWKYWITANCCLEVTVNWCFFFDWQIRHLNKSKHKSTTVQIKSFTVRENWCHSSLIGPRVSPSGDVSHVALKHLPDFWIVGFTALFLQRAAPVKTWQIWVTASETGSSCSTETQSRTTPESLERVLHQVRKTHLLIH